MPFFLDIMLFHILIDIINITFICTRNPQNLCDWLYGDICFIAWSGTEPTTSLRSAFNSTQDFSWPLWIWVIKYPASICQGHGGPCLVRTAILTTGSKTLGPLLSRSVIHCFTELQSTAVAWRFPRSMYSATRSVSVPEEGDALPHGPLFRATLFPRAA